LSVNWGRYILKNKRTQISQIWTVDKKMECQTAEVFCQDPTTEIIKKGFGSSDCKCLTHLFFIKDKKKTEKILEKIGFLKGGGIPGDVSK